MSQIKDSERQPDAGQASALYQLAILGRPCAVGGRAREIRKSKKESADERAARETFEAWLREIEAAAAEIVEVGDLLFRRGEPYRPCAPAAVSALQTRES
jgi:hypothetical protein